MTPDELAEEIEWQFMLGQSSHQAMVAVGYTKPMSLYRQLQRIGRNDLATHFFYRTKEAA